MAGSVITRFWQLSIKPNPTRYDLSTIDISDYFEYAIMYRVEFEWHVYLISKDFRRQEEVKKYFELYGYVFATPLGVRSLLEKVAFFRSKPDYHETGSIPESEAPVCNSCGESILKRKCNKKIKVVDVHSSPEPSQSE